MSQRNKLEAKRSRRILRDLTKGANDIPRYIDLIHYVKMRVRVTTSVAERVILAGALRVDSHQVGVEHTPQGKKLRRYVPADLRDRIQIIVPKAEEA